MSLELLRAEFGKVLCWNLLTMKVLKLDPIILRQESRFHTQDIFLKGYQFYNMSGFRALYILVKNNHKFTEGLGENTTV